MAPEPRTTREYAIATHCLVSEMREDLQALRVELAAQRQDIDDLKTFRTQVKAILAPIALVGGPVLGAVVAWLLHVQAVP